MEQCGHISAKPGIISTCKQLALSQVALNALKQYGIREAKVSLMRLAENASYRIDCDIADDYGSADEPVFAPGRFLLRLHGYQTPSTVTSECDWLFAISSGTDIITASPVKSIADNFSSSVVDVTDNTYYTCSLLRWLKGTHHKHVQAKDFLSLGKLLGSLHKRAGEWAAPKNFQRTRWDWEGMFGARDGFGSIGRSDWDRIAHHYQIHFQHYLEHVADVMSELGQASDAFGLIHGDLNFSNVIYNESRVSPIDFDDCGFGYWIYDIACAVQPYRHRADWHSCWRNFKRGYLARCEQPTGFEYLDTFIAARHIMLLLWAASRAHRNPQLANSLQSRSEAAARAIALSSSHENHVCL